MTLSHDRHLDCVRSVSFHTNELLIASGSDDGTIKIWDLKSSIGKDAVMQKK
jgi:striatin 1/3/4